jgi:hypothetical protein
MGNMSRAFSLFLVIILAVSSMIIIRTASAQTISKPSIPEFTLKVIDNSYDVPATNSTDPFTGKTTTTQTGYRVQNGTIQVAIKNQPFKSYDDESGHTIRLYYSIRFKGHFEAIWSYYPNSNSEHPDYYDATDSDYTILLFYYGENSVTYGPRLGEISSGGQVDFQVEAFIGYYTTQTRSPAPWEPGGTYYYQAYVGETSDWTNTQTITIMDDNSTTSILPSSSPLSVSPSVSPSSSIIVPQQTGDAQNSILFGINWEQIAIILLGIMVIMLVFALVFSLKKRKATCNAV